MENLSEERYKFVIEETKRMSKLMVGESIEEENIIIDYLTCFDWSLGRTPNRELLEKLEIKQPFIIYDYSFVKYANKELVLALIVHECCHLVHGNGHEKEHQELFNQYCSGDINITKNEEYSNFLKRLEELDLFKNNRWVNKPKEPIHKFTKKLFKHEGMIYS